MKKLFLPLTLIFMLVLSACGGDAETVVEEAMEAAEEVAAEVVEEVAEEPAAEEPAAEEAASTESGDEESDMADDMMSGAMIDTSGTYRLTSKFLEAENKCLESNGGPNEGSVLGGATFMDDCQNVVGQIWLITPSEDEGYYHLTSVFMDAEGKRLESGPGPDDAYPLGGATLIDPAQNVTGQFWKFIESEEAGYYRLTSMFMEAENKCLESNGGPNDGSVLGGATFMDDCQAVTGQLWKLIPESVETSIETGPMAFWSGVVWSDGVGVVGATVSVNGVTTVSEDNGFFQVSAPEAMDGRNVINAESDGFVGLSEILNIPSERIVLDMKPAEVYVIDPNAGVDQVDSRGTQVVIDPGQLVDENGNPPAGEITMEMYTYDLENEDMAGDMSGVNDAGEDVSMVSAGAFSTEFTDEDGSEYNLADGATAEISIPATVFPPVEDQPLTVWSYNEETGLWEEEGVATLEDGRYVAEVSHFSKWNFDWEMNQPACIKLTIDANYLAQNPSLQVKAVNGINGQVRTGAVTDIDNVLYNLPANTEMKLYIPHDATAPFATVNTGAPWGGTGLPAAPYDACQGKATFTPPPTTGSLTGIVTDASTTNTAITGANVCIVGTSTCVTTGADGRYDFGQVAAGSYSLETKAASYITISDTAVNVEAGGTTDQPISMSKELAQGQIRIVLTWAKEDQAFDLDANLWYPSGGTDYVNYDDVEKTVDGGNISIERDEQGERAEQGPETIYISTQENGKYQYAVHNFTQRGDGANARSMSGSQAVVRVYLGDQEYTFTPQADASGTWWHVFDLEGTTVTKVDSYSDTQPTAPVQP